MEDRFRAHIEALHPAFERLITVPPVTIMSLPRAVPDRAVYLFSESDKHLYVGRTNRLRPRLQEHGRASSGHNSAPFAFLLAREATGKITATYQAAGSRGELESDPVFAVAFTAAKQRVRGMHIRFVEESDPIRQALLEMYVAVALQTPYNDFDTH
jgi:hypothetical protein